MENHLEITFGANVATKPQAISRMLTSRHLLFIAMLWLVSMVVTPLLDDKVLVEQRPTKLVIYNNTTDTLNFTILEERVSRFTNWQPCNHPKLCGDRGIMPGLSGDMPYELIPNWYPGAEVAVFWWHLLPDSTVENGYRVAGPEKIVVKTPMRPRYEQQR